MCLDCYIVAIEHCADFDFPLLEEQIRNHWLTKNPKLLEQLKQKSEEMRARVRVHNVRFRQRD